jgi:hypothetical protein
MNSNAARVVAAKAKVYRYNRLYQDNGLCGSKFPPSPPAASDIHRILTQSSMAVQHTRFVEAGCAVCGRLSPLLDLTPLSTFTADLSILCVAGVTRKERFNVSDAIEELEGPILADGCDSVCVDCESHLIRGNIPNFALANYSWIGSVPPQLQGLSYAESVMIAKIRHNRCVMRVNSGRVRMHANAIMFPQPAAKVYQKLPLSKKDLSEVLVFVFTGSSAPTDADFARTPMLVRRHQVADALEWLKLNHEGYADLEISEENLASYTLSGVPVVVSYMKTSGTADDSIPAEARSVDNPNDEYGTAIGHCLFAVHGLTSTEYSTKSISELKGIAISHLNNKGHMLGIGR